MVRQPDKPSARRLADRGVDVVAGSLDDRAALGAAIVQRLAADGAQAPAIVAGTCRAFGSR
jgi:hypothetical protein